MTPDRKERSRSKEVPRLRIGQPFNPYRLFTGIFIPEALVRYQGLSCGAKIAYGRLARYAGQNGECFPSIPTLATEIGMGATQARTYVHKLSERFIAIEQRPGSSGVYKFLWHEAFAGEIGDKRKAPPLRKTGGVPLRKTQRVFCDADTRRDVPVARQFSDAPCEEGSIWGYTDRAYGLTKVARRCPPSCPMNREM